MRSALWLAAALTGAAAFSVQAQVPAWSLQAQQRLLAGPDAAGTVARQQHLVQTAETRLAAGDTVAAQQAFDEAALMVHSADVEIGLVRTHLQAGEYRRGLTFASHAAGAHRNVPAGTALYAWLLHLGGQTVVARRALDDALALAPADAALLAARAGIASAWPQPGAALLSPPLRAAPYASGAVPPPGARVVGTATLVGDGAAALAPAALVPSAARLWVRNGMGQTVAATATAATDPRLVLLRLASPLPLPATLAASARPPFAGSPASVLEYGAADSAEAAWPLLRLGFIGRLLAAPGGQLLGIDTPPGPRGGPVFDSAGRWVGIALPGADGRDRLLAAADIDAGLRWPPATAAAAERPGADSVYEAGLRVALQLLAAP